MLSNWKIGKRLTLAFTVALLLVGVVAGAGFWGLSQMSQTITAILEGDAKMMEYAADLETHTLNLRRFEKDIFLNVHDKDKVGEYAAKWKDAHREAYDDVERLIKLASREDTESIRTMRTDLATYAAGFEEILRGINEGTITTAEAANEAITRYKDDIRRLDATSAAFTRKNVEAMATKATTVVDAERRTRMSMWAVCIAGVIIVFFLTVVITRSITAPILEVVELAKKLAEGQNDFDIPSRGTDETGMLLGAMKQMVDSNGQMIAAASGIAAGDLRVRVTPRSDRDALGHALANMIGKLTEIISEVRSGASALTVASTQVSSSARRSRRARASKPRRSKRPRRASSR